MANIQPQVRTRANRRTSNPADSNSVTRHQFVIDGDGTASDYAERLLTLLDLPVRRTHHTTDLHPAIAWARSGAMALTGRRTGLPQMCPFPLASCVEGALVAFAAVAGLTRDALPSVALLSERAVLSGLRRNGAVSAGGATRLLRAADGWVAVSMARDADWELAPAWTERTDTTTWSQLTAVLAQREMDDWVERGRLLGLAVAAARPPSAVTVPAPWYVSVVEAPPSRDRITREPLVLDLSALWAGPLCAHLLQSAGARVIKVESLQRPDGGRLGSSDFFDLLNGGKACVALDFETAAGIDLLRQLIDQADIVIEASRPRALRQLGIDAQSLVAERPGLTWLSISGYGWAEPQGNWIAYGDDAGVAAGLTYTLLGLAGEPLFCGDAIADPITGVHAALLALTGHRNGGGRLLALSLHGVLDHCIRFSHPAEAEELRDRWRNWQQVARSAGTPDRMPEGRRAPEPARTLGADTSAVLADLGIPC